MAKACGKLNKGVAAPCEPAVGGLKTQLVQVRFDDILSITRDADNPKLVEITMKPGATAGTKLKGFLFEGLGESNVGRAKLTPTKFGSPLYTHEVDLIGFDISPDATVSVEALAKDKTVSVVPDNNGYYKVYGLNAGLTASKNDTDTANADTGGAPELTLTSTKEKGLADFFVVMDRTGPTPVIDPVATKAAFEALYA